MPTIYDIAKRAGVSATTVSKVLNGYPDVSEKTRQKVKQITDELGYQPSSAARSLVTRRSMTIGVFLHAHTDSAFRNPFLHEVIASFSNAVGEFGYDLLFFSNSRTPSTPEGFEARARYRDVDGLFLLGVPRTNPDLPELANSETPVVSVDLDLFGARASYLCSDNVKGSHQAIAHLVENGHSKIAFIGDRLGTKPGHDRRLGYQQALLKWSLPYRAEWVVNGDFSESSGYEAGLRLTSCSELPTAVFCASDMMAIGAMKAFEEAGLKAGEDISFVGFDDIQLAAYVKPGLTTIRQNTDEMGRRAALELLELMSNSTKHPSVLSVETQLVVRDSVRSLNGTKRT